MKADEFFALTVKVRAAQKLYFKTRLQGDLIASKQLEAQLDKAIKDGIVLIETKKEQQFTLENVTGGEGAQIEQSTNDGLEDVIRSE
jgi:hypothetical protein